MLTTTAPTIRIANSSRLFKQSNQFISPRSILLQTKAAVQQRNKKIRTTRPNSSPNLVKLLQTYTTSTPSPFLPTKFRSDHSNPTIDPAKVRWRAPRLKAQARALLCKQAFHWRILRHIFNLVPDSLDNIKQLQGLPRSTRNLLNQKPNFYDGSLTIDEFRQIQQDPVPKLIELFGGEERLTVKDKRLLGLFQPPKNPVKSSAAILPTSTPTDLDRDPINIPPRYSVPSIIPNAFGPYIGRRKPFKGKIRERNRQSKISEITQKMVKMDDRIQSYRKEWKAVKEKSKPALPF
ncbi:uncharacterized protein VP01_3044g3 [Puccinia sorghi]|uniref:Large ribosomal subunit protein mL59 domain-containing protein n=1 Tax=Puccinia sorghi TaxID=27349 RepID=A0A0L6UZZ3_9BASI|nr:uncharacterized protein VP01_3044g3 [Puccinia sorghi]